MDLIIALKLGYRFFDQIEQGVVLGFMLSDQQYSKLII